jgi:hydrogenase maturation protein HypF
MVSHINYCVDCYCGPSWAGRRTRARGAARQRGCRQVALAGGCFQNALLLEGCIAGLRAAGLAVFWNRHVPCNDGGLALGQLWAVLRNRPRTKAKGLAAPCASPPLG